MNWLEREQHLMRYGTKDKIMSCLITPMCYNQIQFTRVERNNILLPPGLTLWAPSCAGLHS
jgi:hypothetical protein